MKICVLFLGILIAGSCSDVDAVNHCVATELHSSSDCAQDGNAMTCKFDFLQPYKWGRCGMEKDESLLCEKDGLIAHHPKYSPRPDWSMAAKACAVLHGEIQKHGQGPEMSIPIQIERVPPESKPRT